MFFYCESEQGSSCSTPFVSAPSSPTRTHPTSAPSSSSSSSAPKSNALYYYFSAPSSPPKQPMSAGGAHHRGFSFTECEFQFHSRFVSEPPVPDASPKEEQQEMEDAQLTGFYFSAPTSPDRNKERMKGGGMSIWDEMPGTPKIIFGGGSGSSHGVNTAAPGGFFNADSDFEFSSSRMSDSDSTISAHMSSADELFFKGQLLPMKLRDHQLTSSDSSGSSNTMGGASTSSVAGSAPQSPRFGRKGGDVSPGRVKSAVMGTICGAVMKSSEDDKASVGSNRTRSLSPLQLLRKYQSMMMMMGRPGSSSSSSSSSSGLASSSKSKSSHIPRPARSSSKGRTLRELLHLSSVHKKSKAEAPAAAPPPPDQDVPKPTSSDSDNTTTPQVTETSSIPTSKSVDTISSSGKKTNQQQSPQQHQQQTENRKVERSLLGDYSKRFNKHHHHHHHQQQQQQQQRRRYHSGSILDLHYGYYNSKHRLHSGSIVPESDTPPPPPNHHLMNKLSSDKRLNYHIAPDHNAPSRHARAQLGSSGPLGGGEFNHGSLGGSSHSNRFANVAAVATTLDYHHHSRRWESGVYSYYNPSSSSMASTGVSSASSSRNVSPRRGRHSSGGGGGGGSGSVSLHELHYKSQRGNTEELRRKTFLPYKQGLLGCLGCATMRIAGLSKSLQPMASSR